MPPCAKQEAQIQIAHKLLQIKFTLDLIKAILFSSLTDFEKDSLLKSARDVSEVSHYE